MKKIMIVEDDVAIGNVIEEVLKDHQYQVSRAYSGSEAILQYSIYHPDLILLDLMLPGVDGEVLIEKFKEKAKIIVVSAKSAKQDKIHNLLNGANDYITKPFDLDELLVRIEVQLREIKNLNIDEIEMNSLKINPLTYQTFVDDQEIKLTRSEFMILHLLMSKPNQVFSRSAIFEAIYHSDSIGDEESIKVHISNLRMKLKEVSEQKYIETIWGIGFKFFTNP